AFLECDSREFDIARIVFDEQYLVHELSVGRAGFSGGDRSYLDSVRYEPGRMFLSRRRRTLTQIRSRFRRPRAVPAPAGDRAPVAVTRSPCPACRASAAAPTDEW